VSFPKQIPHGSRPHRLIQAGGWSGFTALVVMVPFLVAVPLKPSILGNDYTIGISNLNTAVSWTVAVLGLNLLTGYSGQFSLGNSFFVGTGAYVTATLVQDYDWPYVVTLLGVLPFCLIVGILIGIPALRISGLYLALITFGLGAIFPSVVKLSGLERWTNGATGKTVDSSLVPPDWWPTEGINDFLAALPVIGSWTGTDDLSSRQSTRVYVYFWLLAIAAIAFLLTSNLLRSRVGRAIVAIRDNPTGAEVSGVNLSLYKTAVFGCSAMLSGVAGTMFAMDNRGATPEEFGQLLSIFLLVGIIVGGVGTLSGAVVGGLAIVFIPHWASQTEELPLFGWELEGPYGNVILGVSLIALMFVMPGGIVSGVRKLRSRFYVVAPAPVEAGSGPGIGSSDLAD
jgi:branched-chain amino acid transport system permease protein